MPRDPASVVRRFGDVQQSMITSHLAGGGAFCCVRHQHERRTVTRSESLQEWLWEFAHENWGCHEDLEESGRRRGHYLEKFLALV